MRVVGRTQLALFRLERDLAAGLGELHRVAQDVHEHFLYLQLVAHHVEVLHLRGIEEKLYAGCLSIASGDGVQLVEQGSQIHRRYILLHPAAFDVAHIQHIVHQIKQMPARDGHLV